jgi:hypothetical protein
MKVEWVIVITNEGFKIRFRTDDSDRVGIPVPLVKLQIE